ncbi:hypothetical protein N9019_01805, partial [Akkermansiaceae bacterium]|nr:hypothetical protein [Akkermansiaceae bacterium]
MTRETEKPTGHLPVPLITFSFVSLFLGTATEVMGAFDGLNESVRGLWATNGLELRGLRATFDYRRTSVTLHGDFNKRDAYRVTLSNSLFSADRLALEKPIITDLKFTRLAPKILLPSWDEAQLSRGSRTYQVKSVNNQSLRIRIKRLSPKDLIRTSLGYRHYTGNGPNTKRIKERIAIPFELITGKVVADTVIEIDADLDTTHTHTLNWNKYLPKKQLGGAFFVS